MNRRIALAEALAIHDRILADSGGLAGILSLDGLESALAQPFATFGGEDLYPSLVDKGATLGFGLIRNHPFADGNKRTGHAVMEMYLMLNRYSISAEVGQQVDIILAVAVGELSRDQFTAWLRAHIAIAEEA